MTRLLIKVDWGDNAFFTYIKAPDDYRRKLAIFLIFPNITKIDNVSKIDLTGSCKRWAMQMIWLHVALLEWKKWMLTCFRKFSFVVYSIWVFFVSISRLGVWFPSLVIFRSSWTSKTAASPLTPNKPLSVDGLSRLSPSSNWQSMSSKSAFSTSSAGCAGSCWLGYS